MNIKHITTVRLSVEAKRLLGALAQQLGISQAAVIELAIREKAQKLRIT